MKILQLIDVYKVGGAEKVYDNYSLFCRSNNDDTDRFCLYCSDSDSLESVLDTNAQSIAGKIVQQAVGLHRLRAIVKNSRYDKIVSFLDRSNIMAIMAARGHILVVATVHNPPTVQYEKLGTLKHLVLHVLRHYYNKKNVRVIAVSNQVKESLTAIGVKNVRIVYNPLVVNKTDCVPISIPKPYFVSVARLAYQKAHWKLIKAMYILKTKFNKILHFVIVGDGILLEKAKTLADSLGLADFVHFVGFIENPFPLISNAFCMVFSSYFEGFPVTVLEAFSCGCPVIGADCAIPEEIRLLLPSSDFYYKNQNSQENFNPHILEEDDYVLAEIMNRALEKPNVLQAITSAGTAWVAENCGLDNFKKYE